MVAADSDSCACIFSPHHFEPTIELAARDCLAGGTDIDSGTTYSSHLANALANSSVLPSRTTVDQALHNTYAMRMRMGLFNPNGTSKYRKFGKADVGSADSAAASLAAARQAMTLFKNEAAASDARAGDSSEASPTLPFAAGSTIAVVGQAVNDTVSYLTGNYNGESTAHGSLRFGMLLL
jgi:beta-D-xylosidase 4